MKIILIFSFIKIECGVFLCVSWAMVNGIREDISTEVGKPPFRGWFRLRFFKCFLNLHDCHAPWFSYVPFYKRIGLFVSSCLQKHWVLSGLYSMALCFSWLGWTIPHAGIEIMQESFRKETSIYVYEKSPSQPPKKLYWKFTEKITHSLLSSDLIYRQNLLSN